MVAQDIPILVRQVVHPMVPRTCLMFVPNWAELLMCNHRDREGPNSQDTNCLFSVVFDSGDLQRRRECHVPQGMWYNCCALWVDGLGSAWQYRHRDMSPVLVICR